VEKKKKRSGLKKSQTVSKLTRRSLASTRHHATKGRSSAIFMWKTRELTVERNKLQKGESETGLYQRAPLRTKSRKNGEPEYRKPNTNALTPKIEERGERTTFQRAVNRRIF